MELDDLFEVMLKEIADELKLQFIKSRAGYIVSNEKNSVGFMTFVGSNGKLKILMSPRRAGKPMDLGSYNKEELKGKDSKARRAIIVKLSNSEFL
ncbi:hypothetical protein J4405_00230 [Candidatus Woesearchaeota archaeon]|nr:hypothetical protein [Candidatus Woesearchaeota archaeon]